MKRRILWLASSALLLAGAAGAQTKISGTAQCSKPDPEYTLEVGDRTGHAMGLEKVACMWTKPMEMEGVKTKDGTSVVYVDMTATRVTFSARQRFAFRISCEPLAQLQAVDEKPSPTVCGEKPSCAGFFD